MNSVSNAWVTVLFHASWQAAVVAAVILVAVRLGRRWPAPVRYGLLLVALAKFALPPILASPWGVFSHWGPEVAAEQLAETPVTASSTATLIESSPAGFATTPFNEAPPEPAMTHPEPAAIRQVASPLPAMPRTATWDWKSAILVLHLSGMAAVAGWLAVQWFRLRQLPATPINDEAVRDRFVAIAGKLGIHRSVRLLVGREDAVPCSFGLLRPAVIVPESLIQDPSDDLDRVLAHELAHHRRGDLWVNAVQLGLFVVWWFHPIYWLLHRSLRTVREDCCDDMVLAAGLATPGEYCETILRVASQRAGSGPLAIATSMADYPHPLERRFRRIMDGSLRRSVRMGWLGLLAVAVLAAVLLPGARGGSGVSDPPTQEAEGRPADTARRSSQPDDRRSWKTPRLGEPRAIVGRVVDGSGKPVPGVKLWLPVRWMPAGPLVAQATADERGRFQIEVPGEWMTAADVFQYDSTIWAYGKGHRIAIASAAAGLFGETPEPVTIMLSTEARTSVRVLKPDETPAVGATIEPYHFRGTVGYEIMPEGLVGIITATTDDSGLAQIPAIPLDGLLNLDIEAEGFGRQRIQTDSSLVEGEPWEISLRPTGRVEGQIVADDPDTAAAVRLSLETMGHLEYPRTTMPPWITEGRSEVITDTHGRFAVEHLAEGMLRISGGLPNEGRMRLWIPDPLEVCKGETTEVTLEVRAGVLVEGRVQEQGTGNPIAGIKVTINPDGPSESTLAVTDRKGHYSTYALPGNATCQVFAPGYARPRGESWQLSIHIPANRQRHAIPTIELVPEQRISGRLIDHEGQGVSNADLRGYSGDAADGRSTVGASVKENGEFRIARPADVNLREIAYYVSGVESQPMEAELLQEEPLVLRLEPPLTENNGTQIVGRVVDARGRPLENVPLQVEARRDEGMRGWTHLRFVDLNLTTQTDGTGRFQFGKLLRRDWQYRVIVESKLDEMLFGTSPWTTAREPVTDLGDAVVKERTFSVRGQIVDDVGKPIAGAVATLRHHRDPLPTGMSDENGRFAFPRVFGVGRFDIRVTAEGYNPHEELMPFTEDDEKRYDGGPRIVLRRTTK